MKKSELRTLVRTIVREEVAMAIHEVITEMKEPLQQVNTVHNGEIRKTKPKKKMVEKKSYTSNSILNDVLNETANEEWSTLGGGTQTSQDMNNVLRQQYGDMMNGGNVQAQVPTTGINGEVVTNVSTNLMDNLTKDYSGMLKSMEKAANKSRGM